MVLVVVVVEIVVGEALMVMLSKIRLRSVSCTRRSGTAVNRGEAKRMTQGLHQCAEVERKQ